jgi:putative transposase
MSNEHLDVPAGRFCSGGLVNIAVPASVTWTSSDQPEFSSVAWALGGSYEEPLLAVLGREVIEALLDRTVEPVLLRSIDPSQCLSGDFRARCPRHHIAQPVGRISSSQDNAVSESFWASLKRELVSRCRFATRADAKRAIIAWINHYNAVRLHSSLGNVPPIEWELRFARRQLPAA